MNVYKVNSLPLKEVIESLAKHFKVLCIENCNEYSLNLPPEIGVGEIRGITFDNGLGIIIYKCRFLADIRIDFTENDVHPIKYIYSVEGPVDHSFANDKVVHHIARHQCAIVASEKNNGHTLSFKKNTDIEILSLEINRALFLKNTSCEVHSLAPALKILFEDKLASKTFYHDGFYGLEFKQLLSENLKYKDKALVRKFYLESISLQIFVNQLLQFEDDLLNGPKQNILRLNDLSRIEEVTKYIKENLSEDLTIVSLSSKTGLNPNKLQTGFKYLFNTTVNEYVVNMRLEKAVVLLKNNDLNVSEIAGLIGIESNSYFSKIFKMRYQISPSKYQKL